MAVGQLTLAGTSNLLFQFNSITAVPDWEHTAQGMSLQYFPSLLEPYAFDGTSREEKFQFDAVLLNTAYTRGSPGTGSWMDQLNDLTYAYNNAGNLIRTKAASATQYLMFSIAFASSGAVASNHDPTTLAVGTQGFVQGSNAWGFGCEFDQFVVKEMDIIQQHVKVGVTLYRVGQVISYD
jgi:hypothetical protein